MDSRMAHILSGCVLRDISFSSPGCPGRAGGSRKTTHALSVTIYRTQHLLRPPRRLSHTQAGRETRDAPAEASGGSSELNQSASCTGVMKVNSPELERYRREPPVQSFAAHATKILHGSL
jgi:hypothetical protein